MFFFFYNLKETTHGIEISMERIVYKNDNYFDIS